MHHRIVDQLAVTGTQTASWVVAVVAVAIVAAGAIALLVSRRRSRSRGGADDA